MAIQQVEYEFPDPDKDKNLQEVEIPEKEPETPELEIEEAVGRETIKKGSTKEKDTIQTGEVEIEVEDDTPPADRGRKSSEAPEKVTDEELDKYSDKVKKRIQHFSKGYHDERRAKEEAQREYGAMEDYARKLVEENQQLKTRSDQNHNALIESAKKQVQSEVAVAQHQYKQAHEAGETDAIIEAQKLLNNAQIRAAQVSNMQPKAVGQVRGALQPQQNNVQSQESAPRMQFEHDKKASGWADKNTWFGNGPEGDPEMTSFAFGLHTKLVNEGVNPQSDKYYERIDARMREIFPDQFDDGIDDSGEPRKKSSTVVAPATRSIAPKKIRLTESQQTIAKRLGVPLKQYAEQVAELARKQDG